MEKPPYRTGGSIKPDTSKPAPKRDKLLIAAAVLLIAVIVVSCMGLARIKAQIKTGLRDHLVTVLKTTHESLDLWADDRIEDTLLFVERREVRRLVKELLALPRSKEALVGSKALKDLRDFARPWLARHSDLGIFVIAPDGISVASMLDENMGDVSFFSEPGYNCLDRMLKGDPQLVLPYRCKVALPGITGELARGEPIMFIGVPVRDDDGSVIAAFTVRIDPSLDFTRIVQIARTGETGDTYAFDKSGRLISGNRFDDQVRKLGLIGPDEHSILSLILRDPGGNMAEGFRPAKARETLPLTRMAQKATSGEAGVDVDGYRDYRGVPVVGAWLWDRGFNFGLAFEIDVAEAYGPYYSIRATVVSVLLATAVLFLTFSIGIIRSKRQTDAANLKLAEEIFERRRSEQRFRVLLESTPDGMIIINRAGEIVLANEMMESLFGYTPEELRGRQVEALIPESFAARHVEHRARFFDDPRPRPMGAGLDLWGLRKDGTEFPAEISLNPVETGDELAVIASIRDITDRKKAEKALRESEKKFKSIFENIQESYFLASMDGTINLVNTQTAAMLGYESEQELLGRNMARDIYADPERRQVLKERLAEYGEVRNFELDLKRKDGTVVSCEAHAHLVYDENQQPVAVEGLARDITERKRAEEALRDSETQLKLILDSMQAGIILIEAGNHRIVHVNEYASKIIGAPAEEIVGKVCHEYLCPEDEGMCPVTDLGETVHASERVLLTRDGRRVPILKTIKRIQFKDKDLLIESFADISDLKRAETTLKDRRRIAEMLADIGVALIQSEDLRAILQHCCELLVERMDAAFARVWTLDDSQGMLVLQASAGMYTRIDGSRSRIPVGDQKVGIIAADRTPHTTNDVVNDPMIKDREWARREGMVAFAGYPLLVDGRLLGVMALFARHELSSYKLYALSTAADNIALGLYRKIYENKLRQLSLAIEQSPASVVVTDRDGTIDYVNPKFTEITGYSAKEAVGQNPRILKSGEHPPEFYKELWETILAGKEWRGEFYNKKKDGDFYWESASISPIHNEKNEITHFVAVKEDITERKRLAEELQRAKESAEAASQAKSDFLAGMSHELRTPLNAIIGFSEMLEDRIFGEINERQEEIITDIWDSGKHLLSLINDILDLSKIEAGKMELDRSEVHIKGLLEHSLVMIREKALKHGISLNLELPEKLSDYILTLDERKVKQVMYNLLSNAAKFTPDGGAISVEARREDDELILGVRDTGIGIAPEDRERIFEEFYQVRGGIEGKTPGTGLGLSLVKSIVEMHGGRVWVESEGLGKGSLFSFSLPIKK